MSVSILRFGPTSFLIAVVAVGCAVSKPVVVSPEQRAFETELKQLAESSKSRPDACAEHAQALESLKVADQEIAGSKEKETEKALADRRDLPKVVAFLEQYPEPSKEFLRANQMIARELPPDADWDVLPFYSVRGCAELPWFEGVKIAVNSLGKPSARKARDTKLLEARLRRLILGRVMSIASVPSSLTRQLIAAGSIRHAVSRSVLPADEATLGELPKLWARAIASRDEAKSTPASKAARERGMMQGASKEDRDAALASFRASIRAEMKAAESLRSELTAFLARVSPL